MEAIHTDKYLASGCPELFGEGEALKSWVSPWQATDLETILAMARLAEISPSDVVLDIGCGDGRVLTKLSQITGCRGIGIDVADECVDAAKRMAKGNDRVQFLVRDATTPEGLLHLPLPSVIYAYLVSKGLESIKPAIKQQMQMGGATQIRLITHEYHYNDASFKVVSRDVEADLRVSRFTWK